MPRAGGVTSLRSVSCRLGFAGSSTALVLLRCLPCALTAVRSCLRSFHDIFSRFLNCLLVFYCRLPIAVLFLITLSANLDRCSNVLLCDRSARVHGQFLDFFNFFFRSLHLVFFTVVYYVFHRVGLTATAEVCFGEFEFIQHPIYITVPC